MPITSDIRNYADTAIEQGRHVVGQAVGQAQANVNQLTTRATGAVADLRTQAEKTLNVDGIRTAVEPYLAQAKQYRSNVSDRAEGLFETVKSDKRVAKALSTAESVTGAVVGTVTERVVKPVATLTGRGSKPASATTSRKSTVTKPAASKSTAKKSTPKKTTATKASKPAATRPAAKKTATKSPAKKTTASS
jgi:hypothetical protein